MPATKSTTKTPPAAVTFRDPADLSPFDLSEFNLQQACDVGSIALEFMGIARELMSCFGFAPYTAEQIKTAATFAVVNGTTLATALAKLEAPARKPRLAATKRTARKAPARRAMPKKSAKSKTARRSAR